MEYIVVIFEGMISVMIGSSLVEIKVFIIVWIVRNFSFRISKLFIRIFLFIFWGLVKKIFIVFSILVFIRVRVNSII